MPDEKIDTIQYQLPLEGKVQTRLGEVGIVKMWGYDARGIQYQLLTKGGLNWYREEDLNPMTVGQVVSFRGYCIGMLYLQFVSPILEEFQK